MGKPLRRRQGKEYWELRSDGKMQVEVVLSENKGEITFYTRDKWELMDDEDWKSLLRWIKKACMKNG